jgi:hypothetical protein
MRVWIATLVIRRHPQCSSRATEWARHREAASRRPRPRPAPRRRQPWPSHRAEHGGPSSPACEDGVCVLTDTVGPPTRTAGPGSGA